MPLPVLHSFAGYSIYRLSKKYKEERDWKLAVYCILLANLADLDFIPGMFLNDPNLCHRGISHSLGAALLFAIPAAVYQRWAQKNESLKVFCISLAAYYSHIILDFFGGTSRPIPLFWPFRPNEYHWPVSLLNAISARAEGHGTLGFLLSFLNSAVVERLVVETSIVFFICSFSRFIKRLRETQIEPAPALVSLALSLLFFMTAVAVKAVAG